MILVRDIGFRSSAAILDRPAARPAIRAAPYTVSAIAQSAVRHPHAVAIIERRPCRSLHFQANRRCTDVEEFKSYVMPAAPPPTIHRSANTNPRKLMQIHKHSVFAYTPNPIGKRITSQECKKLSQLQMVTPFHRGDRCERMQRYLAAAIEASDATNPRETVSPVKRGKLSRDIRPAAA